MNIHRGAMAKNPAVWKLPFLSALTRTRKASEINMEENGIRWFPRASNLLESPPNQVDNHRPDGKNGDDISIACRLFGKTNRPLPPRIHLPERPVEWDQDEAPARTGGLRAALPEALVVLVLAILVAVVAHALSASRCSRTRRRARSRRTSRCRGCRRCAQGAGDEHR